MQCISYCSTDTGNCILTLIFAKDIFCLQARLWLCPSGLKEIIFGLPVFDDIATRFKAQLSLADSSRSNTEAINDFRGMENSWVVPTDLPQSKRVANDLSDTITLHFPLESDRKLDAFQYVATNCAVHTYDNSCSYDRLSLDITTWNQILQNHTVSFKTVKK
ncbi:hypothetical protein AVEN_85058-1 [Araneus ventricosus]|uniref:Uncharacterized protein n=1 Tax=Araneus ventricosus TaxID=182803 RepID=A0A4Y2QUQ0_ARAVE|nr:hypothetical protein AVEN_85058-1 [Araneus ventricosus]